MSEGAGHALETGVTTGRAARVPGRGRDHAPMTDAADATDLDRGRIAEDPNDGTSDDIAQTRGNQRDVASATLTVMAKAETHTDEDTADTGRRLWNDYTTPPWHHHPRSRPLLGPRSQSFPAAPCRS